MKSKVQQISFAQRLILTALIALAAAVLHSYSSDRQQAPVEAQHPVVEVERTASR